jgi:leader peptidase (prepilin peptidase)/N-methyltransferase
VCLGQVLLYFMVFLTGVAAGSFSNILIFGYLQGLPLRALFKAGAVVSFLNLLKRKRGNHIEKSNLFYFYPVELGSAAIFVLCYHFFGPGIYFLKYAVMLQLLLIISILDIQRGVIPNRFVLLLFFWLFIWQFVWPYHSLQSVALGFLIGGALFYVISMLSRGGMGGGDIKLMAVLGFSVGWPYVLIIFMISFVLGALAGVILLAAGKRVLKDSLPFAPFLSLGFLLVIFWGVEIWQWYSSFW